jgi:hypothetical protein
MTPMAMTTEQGTVEIVHEGKTYVGRYAIKGQRRVPTVRVSYNGRAKTARTGSGIAELLLMQLVEDELRRQKTT